MVSDFVLEIIIGPSGRSKNRGLNPIITLWSKLVIQSYGWSGDPLGDSSPVRVCSFYASIIFISFNSISTSAFFFWRGNVLAKNWEV